MAGAWKSYRNKPRRNRFYKRKAFWGGFLLITVLLGLTGLVAWEVYSKKYSDRALTYDVEAVQAVELPSIILDRNGAEIGRIFVENRSVINYGDVPLNFMNALKASEDSRFDDHNGVDYIGIGRAVLKAIVKGRVSQGASTITQQLARDAYGLKSEAKRRNESGFKRKLVEMFLAKRLEQRYRKDEIMTFFVNRTFLGSGYYGLRSASLGYFGKEPHELNVVECASIVTILRNPFDFSPLKDIAANKRGRDYVLWRMSEEGMITEAEYNEFKLLPVSLNPKPLQRGTSHVHEMIASQAREKIGEDAFAKGGFTIYTPLIKSVQDKAINALNQQLRTIETREGYANMTYAQYRKGINKPQYLQGAVMVMEHDTGNVIAYVGGRDYNHSQYDFIKEGKKPLGTAFFPFLVASAFSNGITPAVMLEDEPMDNRTVMVGGNQGVLGEWGAEIPNPAYEQKSITLRKAFTEGKVAAMVRLGTATGVNKVADCAKRFGFQISNEPVLPKILLGTEAVNMKEAIIAMSAFAKDGEVLGTAPVFVEKIEDTAKHAIWIQSTAQISPTAAIDPASSYQVHSLLRDTLENGYLKDTAKDMPTGFLGGVKTGTMHDFSNTWALGYTPRVVCGVWNGFLQGNSKTIYEGAFGKNVSLPIWEEVMKALPAEFITGEIHKPSNIIEVKVCKVSGQIATEYCYENIINKNDGIPQIVDARSLEYFRAGTEKIPACTIHSGSIVSSSQRSSVAIINAIPIRAKEALILGKDPYHTEVPQYVQQDIGVMEGAFYETGDSTLEMMTTGDQNAQLPQVKPTRLEIEVE